MTPGQLAYRARAELRKSGNPHVAGQQRAYFKKWEKPRYAIARFLEAKRRHILAATRKP